MKIKNYEAVTIYSKLNEVLKNYSFKARVCKAIIDNKNKLKAVIDSVEETRQTLIRHYAEVDENGEPKVSDNSYVLKDKEGFAKEFTDLQNDETDIELTTISIDDLGDTEINGADFEALSIFIA